MAWWRRCPLNSKWTDLLATTVALTNGDSDGVRVWSDYGVRVWSDYDVRV